MAGPKILSGGRGDHGEPRRSRWRDVGEVVVEGFIVPAAICLASAVIAVGVALAAEWVWQKLGFL